MGEKSCQPFGLQPEWPLPLSRGLLIFEISASPRFAVSTILAATHTCFIVLGALNGASRCKGRTRVGLDRRRLQAVPEKSCGLARSAPPAVRLDPGPARGAAPRARHRRPHAAFHRRP